MAQLGSGVYIRPISNGWGWGPPANVVSPHCGLVADALWASPTFGGNIERPQVYVDRGMALETSSLPWVTAPPSPYPAGNGFWLLGEGGL